jgi:lactate dehydrogenase-like 2-hydroxyacid dehydrogenase
MIHQHLFWPIVALIHVRIQEALRTGAEHCISSDGLLELEALPRRLAVIGAGYIGCEFGGIFSALGCHVEYFLRGDKMLAGFDEEVRAGFCGLWVALFTCHHRDCRGGGSDSAPRVLCGRACVSS